MGINDIPKNELIERAAKQLQSVEAVKAPDWAMFVKTGTFKDRQPARDDWWHVRAAAVLRRLAASRGPLGVQKLRVLYGGKKNRGHKPERFYRGSGNILRKVLQQLEKAGFVKQMEKGNHKGRVATPEGFAFLGKIADGYMKENKIVLPKTPGGNLKITEMPKEKQAKKPRVRKKAAPVEGAEAKPKPKRKRAPRKKKVAAPEAPAAEAAPKAEEKPAEKKEEPKPEAPKTEEKPAEAKPEPKAEEKPAETKSE